MASDGFLVFCEILLAIILPPLGLCLKDGCCTCEFLICVILTLLGYIPGIIYAVYIITVKRKRDRGLGSSSPEGVYNPLP